MRGGRCSSSSSSRRWGVMSCISMCCRYAHTCLTDSARAAVLASPAAATACCPLSPAAFALICDYVSNADPGIRAGAILGLGLAYAGTQREEVQELLVPLVRARGGAQGST